MFTRGFVCGVVVGLGGYVVATVMRGGPLEVVLPAESDTSLATHPPTVSQAAKPASSYVGRMQQEQQWLDKLALAVPMHE